MHDPSNDPTRTDQQGVGFVESWADEEGSLVTEYGLLAVVAATIAGVLIQWATGGAVVNLFNALVDRARELVGA
jgi:Flp pilus assembly pilin Flp